MFILRPRSRFVGNTVAKFVLQCLGCEVTAINTVNYSKCDWNRFKIRMLHMQYLGPPPPLLPVPTRCHPPSAPRLTLRPSPPLSYITPGNHTAYGQVKGTKITAEQLSDLFHGLEQSKLADDIDVLLTGYIPSAAVLVEVGNIARTLQARKKELFWGESVG